MKASSNDITVFNDSVGVAQTYEYFIVIWTIVLFSHYFIFTHDNKNALVEGLSLFFYCKLTIVVDQMGQLIAIVTFITFALLLY